MKPIIHNLSVICVAGNKHGESLASLYKAKSEIDAARYLLITNIDITATGIECINVGGLNTWDKYNRFIVKELYKYFETDYCLLVQWDGIVDNGSLWSNDFLDYDYIGASWLNGECGNGGFSGRSRRLMEIVATDDFIEIVTPEDNCICILYKKYLQEKYNITYAPKEVCDRFSFELNEPLSDTFGHHSFHWPKFRETVVFKRSHALGDVLQIEPVMYHYHKLGYQVALETNDHCMAFFNKHYFPVVPRKHLNPNLPVKEIDLNMAYEVKPKQLHLQSYYDFAQIKDGAIKNPTLSLPFDYRHPQNKLFKKYAIIHIDKRNEPYRNIYGVKWELVVEYLKKYGYDVIQLGNGEHEEIKGALFMVTLAPEHLMWAVASSDLFIGIDSGISHVASGFDIPSIIFFGSVNPDFIHPDRRNKIYIHNHDKNICDTPFCWHDSVTQSGKECVVDVLKPPCTQFTTIQCMSAIDKIVKGNPVFSTVTKKP